MREAIISSVSVSPVSDDFSLFLVQYTQTTWQRRQGHRLPTQVQIHLYFRRRRITEKPTRRAWPATASGWTIFSRWAFLKGVSLNSYYGTSMAVFYTARTKLHGVVDDWTSATWGRNDATSFNVLAIPVESRRPCGQRSNLNLLKHVWDTCMFSFHKHATRILPSSEHAAYIDPRAESDGW